MPDAGRNSCDPRDRRTENVIAQIAVLCASVHTREWPRRFRARARMRFRPCPRVDFRSWINKGISFGARPARYFQDIFRSPFGEYYFSSQTTRVEMPHTRVASGNRDKRAEYIRARVCLKYISRDDAPCESPDEYIYRRPASRRGFIFAETPESQRLIFPRTIKILASSG